MYLVNLVVGDWSNDGHGRSDTFLVSVANTSKGIFNPITEIQDAFKVGEERQSSFSAIHSRKKRGLNGR